MIRQLPGPALCVPALALLLAAPAAAQTIYLGEQEVDTADRGAVRAAIERCAALAAAAPGAQQAASFTRGSATPQPSDETPAAPAEEQQSSSDETPAAEDPAVSVDRAALSLSVDALASSGEGSVASGDGGGSGTRPPGTSAESDQSGEGESREGASDAAAGDDGAMASVTLQACKEAGLVY